MGGVTALAVGTLAFSSPAQALTLFSGNYNVSNWTLNNTNANGSVNTTNAPTSITLTGGDNGSGAFGATSFTITSPESGTLSFDWNYNTSDNVTDSSCTNIAGDFCDPFRFLLNGTPTTLISAAGGVTQSGSFSTFINTGDNFGFQIATSDNGFGAASVTIQQGVTPVPFEFSPLLGLGVLGGLFAAKKLIKKSKKPN